MENGFITRYVSKENPTISWGIATEEDSIPVQIPYVVERIDGEENRVFVNEGDIIIYENDNIRVFNKGKYDKMYDLVINDIENSILVCSKCKENISFKSVLVKDVINSEVGFSIVTSDNKASIQTNNDIFYFIDNKIVCKECFINSITNSVMEEFVSKYGEKSDWDNEVEIKFINFSKTIYNKFKVI